MGCHSSREKNALQNLGSILEKYTLIANCKGLELTTPLENNDKEENEYFQFAAKVLKSKPLTPTMLKDKRKLRETLQYPFYMIGWKFEKKLVAIGSAYEYKTLQEKVAVIQDIMIDNEVIQEKSLELLTIQSLLIKALATIVFELESVNYVRLDGDPSVYAELLQNKAEPKMTKEQYNKLKVSNLLLDHKPIPLQLNIFEKASETVTSGVRTVGDGLVSGVTFVGSGVASGVSMVGNGVITGVTAVGSGVVTAGKFVGNTVGSAATKVGDVIIPGKKEEKKEQEMQGKEEHKIDESHAQNHHEEHHEDHHEDHDQHIDELNAHEEKPKRHSLKEEEQQHQEKEIKEVTVEILHEEKEGMDIEKVTQAEEK